MADLTITPANVQPSDTVQYYLQDNKPPLAGEALQAGQLVYLETTGLIFLVDLTNPAKSSILGLMVANAAVQQACSIATGGQVKLGSGVSTAGTWLWGSATPGALNNAQPTVGQTSSLGGYMIDADNMMVYLVNSGIVKA